MTRRQAAPCPPALLQAVRRQQVATLAVACPQCEAQPGKPCTSPSGRKLSNQHASRFEAAGLPTELETAQ